MTLIPPAPAPLLGKRIFITGASRGLGRAIALQCAAQGADIAFNYAQDDEAALATQKEIAALGRNCLIRKISVLDKKSLETFAAEIAAAWGGIDILVNNAGISQPLPFPLIEEADWDKVFDINVKGTFLSTKAVLRNMLRQRSGVILNVGSLAGSRVLEAPAHYGASKAALSGFTVTLAKELARYGIRVNCLAPGLLDDGVGGSLPEHRRQEYTRHTALGRVGKIEEAAQCAAFMVSDLNSYQNGAVVIMDGGL